MGIKDLAWDKVKWKFMKRRLGYSGEEMQLFRDNPRNEEVLSKVPEINKKRILADALRQEAVRGYGCLIDGNDASQPLADFKQRSTNADSS